MLMTISFSSVQNIFADNLAETKDDFLKTFSTENQYIKYVKCLRGFINLIPITLFILISWLIFDACRCTDL